MEYFGLRVAHLNHQEKLRKTRSRELKFFSLNFQRSISRIHWHALSVNHSFPRINQACVPVTYLKLKLNGLIFCWYIFAPFLCGSVFALGLKGDKHYHWIVYAYVSDQLLLWRIKYHFNNFKLGY